MPGLCRREKLKPNTGQTWRQIKLGKLTAMRVTETTLLDNPQQYDDSVLTITPTGIAIHTFITDELGRRADKKALATMGIEPGRAMARLVDSDGFTAIDSFTTSLCGTGTTLTSGYINAASARIRGNTTEAVEDGEINAVFHDYGIKDLEDELLAGIGTYNVQSGKTSEVYSNGFRGKIAGVNIHRGNVPIDTTPDSKGGVFYKGALILVEGFALKKDTQRDIFRGMGGTHTVMYHQYAYGEDGSGQWGYEVQHDATTPSS